MTQMIAANGVANGAFSQQAQYAVGQPTDRTAKTPHGVPCLLLVSIFQLVLGVLCALLGIAVVVMENFIYYTGYPIWSGVLFFSITGILGIVAACTNRNKCLITAFMIMSILASIDAGLMLIPSIWGAAIEESDPSCTRHYESYVSYFYCDVAWEARLAVDAVIAVVALAEMVFAIVGSACSCYGLSKDIPNSAPDTEMQVRYVPQQQQQRATQFVPVINTQQQQQHQPLQLQAVPGPTAVPGGYLVSSPHIGQGLAPTQHLGLASQQATLPQQHSGRSTPLLSVSQQHSGRSTPQMVYTPQLVGAAVAGPPRPISMSAQLQAAAKTEEADRQQSGVPVQHACRRVAQQIGVDYQQEGSSSQQSGGALQPVGMGPGQVQMGTQQAGVGSTRVVMVAPQVGMGSPLVGIGAPQLGVPPQDMAPQPQGLPRVQPDIVAEGRDPQPATFPASDKKERDDADQEFDELEMAMGGDEQYDDDKQLLIETE